MARQEEHLQKATQNEIFAASLDLANRCHLEWAITAVFYAALHHVNAYFAHYGVTCQSHEQTRQEISRDPRIKGVFGDYRELETLAHAARYTMRVFSERDYTLHAKPILEKIKAVIKTALAP